MLRCSFCAKSEQEIAKLAAGPGGIHICNECVEACRLIMDGDTAPARAFDPSGWSTERLLATLEPVNRTAEAHRAHLQSLVDQLRARDISWARIAAPLGVTRQTAWERFG